jgi:phosphonate dehydrogenase
MKIAKQRVLVTHWVHKEVASYLKDFCDPLIPSAEDGVWPAGEIAELAADAVGMIACMADRVDDAFLARCPNLRVISATLKGYDNFDVEACTRRGVWLTVLPDALTVPTAELAVGLAIGIMRHVAEADRLIRRDGHPGWRPRFYGSGLSGSTAGLVGMGQVGQAVATRLRAFGTRIVYHDVRGLPDEMANDMGTIRVGLDELLAQSDVVLILAPLTPATGHMINSLKLALMRPGTYLVNISRGSVVDESAVAEALYEGRLAGYAADVFAMEDIAQRGHPEQIPGELLRHPRTLFTPHLGSAVDGIRRDMSMTAARQVWQVLNGHRPDHAVNRPLRGPARRR